jgi:hypothetical protein
LFTTYSVRVYSRALPLLGRHRVFSSPFLLKLITRFAREMASPPTPAAAAERRIVVAVDEGEESMHALAWCLANVVSSDAADTVVLLHARRPRPVYAAMDSAGTYVRRYSVNFESSVHPPMLSCCCLFLLPAGWLQGTCSPRT